MLYHNLKDKSQKMESLLDWNQFNNSILFLDERLLIGLLRSG